MIIVLSGPGGVGKGTIVDALVAADPTLHLSRSWTTRPRRIGEDPESYVWVTREQFEAHRALGGFLETDEFLGNYYGTPRPPASFKGDLLLEINVAGAAQVRATEPSVHLIFVVAPSHEAQETRLRRRGDDEAHVQRRLAIAAAEEERGRAMTDHIVVNDDLSRAVAEVAGKIARWRVQASV